MIIERINRDTFNEEGRDFVACEGKWTVDPVLINEKVLEDLFNRQRETVLGLYPDKDASELAWDNVKGRLEEGKVVADMFCLYRIKTDKPKCPLCGSSFRRAEGALSRKDNQTVICSDCGTTEALLAYVNSGMSQG